MSSDEVNDERRQWMVTFFDGRYWVSASGYLDDGSVLATIVESSCAMGTVVQQQQVRSEDRMGQWSRQALLLVSTLGV